MFEIEKGLKSDLEKSKKPAPKKWPGVMSAYDFVESTATSFHQGPKNSSKGYQFVAWCLASNLIDALVAVSMLCLFLFSALLVSQFSFQARLRVSQDDLRLFFVMYWFLFSSYLLVARIFWGCTVGEWACGLRLGFPRQRFLSNYSLKVLGRFLLVLSTGVITLKILSYLTGQDLAGKLSGLPLILIEKNKS